MFRNVTAVMRLDTAVSCGVSATIHVPVLISQSAFETSQAARIDDLGLVLSTKVAQPVSVLINSFQIVVFLLQARNNCNTFVSDHSEK